MFSWFTKDVSALLAQFTKIVTRLEKVADYHVLQAEIQDEAIKSGQALRDFAIQEAIRAKAVAQKIRDLVA